MRPKIIYILGSGRCGSTLVNCVLGQAEGFAAPGEIGLIWDRLVTGRHMCDCGIPFRDCPFWKKVLQSILPGQDEVAAAKRLNRLHWKLTGLKGTPGFLLRPFRTQLNSDQRRYLDQLLQLYVEIGRRSDSRVIVDSSKRPLHADLLTKAPECDVRIIHLIRDARAVVYSQLARTKRSARYLAARWLLVNLLCEAVARRHPARLLLRYEDFCLDPQSSLKTIASFVDESLAPIRVSPAGEISLQRAHGVGGDTVRFQEGLVKVAANEAWRREMDPSDFRITTWMARPLLSRYGYPVKRGAQHDVW